VSLYLDDGDVRLYHGDALEQLALMPSESVQCIVTSPPFWGLRDYGTPGQIGLEETPDEWCSKLVAVMREARRVLRSDGVCWLECGDSYNSGTSARRKSSQANDVGAWQNGGEHGACATCNAPWRRITERTQIDLRKPGASSDSPHRGEQDGRYGNRRALEVETSGWEPSCDCDHRFRKPCLVLDPFMGSATTALVARRLGRHAIGIELNLEYLQIAAKRLQQLSLLGGTA
jgi:site-specific DNA-methyltransferase (adenine-specific)